MPGPEFFQTRMGQRFYEVDVPRIVSALERIAEALKPGQTTPPLVDTLAEQLAASPTAARNEDSWSAARRGAARFNSGRVAVEVDVLERSKGAGPWIVVVPGETSDPTYHTSEAEAVHEARERVLVDPGLHVYVCEVHWATRSP